MAPCVICVYVWGEKYLTFIKKKQKQKKTILMYQDKMFEFFHENMHGIFRDKTEDCFLVCACDGI